jgi:cytochrome c-type biogenesis protein CcmH/NrfG
MRQIINMAALMLAISALAACTNSFYGGAAAGAGAAGVTYEVYNKRQLDQLERDYERGDISAEEYERRRREVEDRSLVY